MPKFGADKLLEPKQIADVAEYVLSSQASRAQRGGGRARPQGVCRAVRGLSRCRRQGQPRQGAPNLTDGIWLYGGTKEAVIESIRTGRGGSCRHGSKLDDITIKSLAVYVHWLGGGK